MHLTDIRSLVLRILVTLGVVVSGCGDDEAASPNDATQTSDATDTTSATIPTDAAADTPVVDPCAETNLAGCVYPERKLALTERTFELNDTTTARTLPILARVPEGAGPFPVVIWSHGGGFDAAGQRLSADWGKAIAAQGYVVFHVGHVMPTPDARDAICALAGVPPAECTGSGGEDDNGLLAIFKTYDVLTVLGRLEGISDASAGDGGPALDLDRVAVAGWSAGARAPSLLSGAVVDSSATGPRFTKPDARVHAVVMLSPAGPGFGGYFDDGAATSWDAMGGPVLWLTGQNDVKSPDAELNGPVRRFGFSHMPADGQRWLLYSNLPIGVGGHGTYNLGDADANDTRLVRLSRALRSTVLAYLDAHLRDDPTAQAWLATQNARTLAGDVDWEHR